MGINISKLNKERVFEDEKIKISFSTGDVSDSFSVYIKDENGKLYHILWEISNDRCNQNFDKTNKKIKEFAKNKISEWVTDQEEAKRIREESIRNREKRERDRLTKLMDTF